MGDRRRHKRITFLREMEISCPNHEVAKALAVNISRSGLVLYCNKHLAVENEIGIRLLFVDEYKVDRIETVIGDVCWVKPLEEFCAAGLQFRSLNEHDHFMLLAYLNYAEGFGKPCINE